MEDKLKALWRQAQAMRAELETVLAQTDSRLAGHSAVQVHVENADENLTLAVRNIERAVHAAKNAARS